MVDVRNTVSKKIDNYIIICIFSLFLLITNIFKMSITSTIITFVTSYIIFIIYSYKSLKSIKKMFLSAEVIYISVFFVYAIPASIMYILDGNTPRISFFLIDDYTMFETLKIYFYINCISVILIAITGGIHTMDFYTKEKDLKRSVFGKFDFFDLIALVICIYYYYLHFRNGFSILQLYFQDIRQIVFSGIGNLSSYLYLYMVPYSAVNIYIGMYRKHEKSKSITYKEFFVIIVLVLFWGLSLVTDRRNFITLLFMLILIYFYKLKKIEIKKIIALLLIIVVFLSISFFRARTSSREINDIIFLSAGEFILVNYVSNFYIDNCNDLQYGSTYIWNTLTSVIPRRIYPDKPKMLSEQFKEQANTNVAYAFNPVAEGMVNFGEKGAIVVVPFVILFWIKMAYSVSKRHFLYYIIICAESINFFRGIFSVSFFSITVMIIVTMLMLKITPKNKRRENIWEIQ